MDRVILPFLASEGQPAQLHAHRIILLVPGDPTSRRTAAEIRRALKSVAVLEEEQLEPENVQGATGFQEVLERISRVCLRELGAGNRVHVNLSSGSKVVCVAAGFAAMANLRPGQGSVYYVRPNGQSVTQQDFQLHGRSKGVLAVDEIDLVPVLLPEPLQLRLLGYLRHRPQQSAVYRDLVGFLCAIPGSDFRPLNGGKAARRVRSWNNATTTRMVRRILTPLAAEGLLEIRMLGREKGARLTTRGLLYAAMAAPAESDLLKPLGRVIHDIHTNSVDA